MSKRKCYEVCCERKSCGSPGFLNNNCCLALIILAVCQGCLPTQCSISLLILLILICCCGCGKGFNKSSKWCCC